MNVTSTHSPLSRLSKLGQSVWIDYLSRDLIESGELMRLVREDAVVGVTSNPSIFAEALSKTHAYDAQLIDISEHETNLKQISTRWRLEMSRRPAHSFTRCGRRREGSTATCPGRSPPFCR